MPPSFFGTVSSRTAGITGASTSRPTAFLDENHKPGQFRRGDTFVRMLVCCFSLVEVQSEFGRMLRHLAVLVFVFMATPVPAASQEEKDILACSEDPAFGWLDFWVGTWDVMVQSGFGGTNEIRKILNGCAVTEEWTSAEGKRGFSLFYYRPASRAWQQVWVTDRALAQGGVKEKTLVERLPNGGVRFQGEAALPDGRSYIDRTTLKPLNTNEVEQVIEVSLDDGESWTMVFQGHYLRRAR
jgi:hypothetical protein